MWIIRGHLILEIFYKIRKITYSAREYKPNEREEY